MASSVDVGEELFQFLVGLEDLILRHVLDRLDRLDALALDLLTMAPTPGAGSSNGPPDLRKLGWS